MSGGVVIGLAGRAVGAWAVGNQCAWIGQAVAFHFGIITTIREGPFVEGIEAKFGD